MTLEDRRLPVTTDRSLRVFHSQGKDYTSPEGRDVGMTPRNDPSRSTSLNRSHYKYKGSWISTDGALVSLSSTYTRSLRERQRW